MELSAEILKDMSIIAEDDNATSKLLRYVRKLAKSVCEKRNSQDITDIIASGLRQVKMEQEGKIELKSLESLINELGS